MRTYRKTTFRSYARFNQRELYGWRKWLMSTLLILFFVAVVMGFIALFVLFLPIMLAYIGLAIFILAVGWLITRDLPQMR